MSSVIVRRKKYRSSPPQPLDRHLSEIGEFDGTIYINAGIDSTWLVVIFFFLIFVNFIFILVVKNLFEQYIN
jgi:hypothetical protein